MHVRFIGYYFFKIDKGIVSMKHLLNSLEGEQVCVFLILLGTIRFVKLALLSDLLSVLLLILQ